MPIYSAEKTRYSPPEMNVISGIKTDIPIVLVTRINDFVFNDELKKLDRYILCCLSEYGWDWDLSRSMTHKWGENTHEFPQFDTDEWRKFDDWVAGNKPLLTLKRELVYGDESEIMHPIDYPNYQPIYSIQSKEEFDNRLVEVFMFWGRSSEHRVRVHSEIWANSGRYGYSVNDNIYYTGEFLKNEQGKKWVTINTPHYCRHQLSDILAINGISKLSISLAGGGVKCFRSTGESIVNSIQCTHYNDLVWSFPFEHNKNMITLFPGREIDGLLEALRNPNLYDVYLGSMEAARFYQFDNYTKHLEKTINQFL